MKLAIIPCVAGQKYAPWINPDNVHELNQSTWLSDLLWFLWNTLVHSSYWIACIGCVIFIIYYAVTRNRKCIEGVGILFVSDVLIKGINAVITK